MKQIREIRVVFRNKFIYRLRRLLPKNVIVGVEVAGHWRVIKTTVGIPYKIKCRRLVPVSLFDAILFVYLVKRS